MIIGFTGKARSGKSTATNHLLSKSDRPRVKIGFKDSIVDEMKQNFGPLLDEISHVYNIGSTSFWDTERLFTDKPPLMRKLMQCYGTEVRRGDDTNYWIKKWKSKVSYTKEDVVCDDLRFLNEAEAVKDMGGYIIRIVREDITDTGSHQSELEMDQIVPDFTVVSKQGDLEGLYRQLDAIIAELSTGGHLSQVG